MIIHCTKKVLDASGIKDIFALPENEDPLFSWHANVITVDRRRILFFVNDLTGIVVIFYRPKKADYRSLNKIVSKGITDLMRELGFHEDVIQKYLADDDNNIITKTKDRSFVARMNQAGYEIEWQSYDYNTDYGLQLTGMIRASKDLLSAKENYAEPRELFIKEIKDRYGDGTEESVLDHASYVLRIKLDLKKHDIYRIVEVPSNITFFGLHLIIQDLFEWQDVHCHSFEMYDGTDICLTIYDGSDPPDEACMDPYHPNISDMGIRVKEIFSKYGSIVYTYDFGDNWEHIITVQERKEKNGAERARLIESKGTRPPEDVGGELGYEEYLRIISNPEDPEYENTVAWTKEQLPREMTDEELTRRLSWIR